MQPWKLGLRSKEDEAEPDADTVARRLSIASSRYRWLYKYLEGRYSNRVVLTFAEIEDLLGFSLPDLARRSEEWWTKPELDPTEPRCSDSWTLAHRTARPNLLALNVVFDRV